MLFCRITWVGQIIDAKAVAVVVVGGTALTVERPVIVQSEHLKAKSPSNGPSREEDNRSPLVLRARARCHRQRPHVAKDEAAKPGGCSTWRLDDEPIRYLWA